MCLSARTATKACAHGTNEVLEGVGLVLVGLGLRQPKKCTKTTTASVSLREHEFQDRFTLARFQE